MVRKIVGLSVRDAAVSIVRRTQRPAVGPAAALPSDAVEANHPRRSRHVGAKRAAPELPAARPKRQTAQLRPPAGQWEPLNAKFLAEQVLESLRISTTQQLVIIDFDWTLLSCDAGKAGARRVMSQGAPNLSWPQLQHAVPILNREVHGISLIALRHDLLRAWQVTQDDSLPAKIRRSALKDFSAKAALHFELFDNASDKNLAPEDGPFWLRWFAGSTEEQMRAEVVAALQRANQAAKWAGGNAVTMTWQGKTAGLAGKAVFKFTQAAVTCQNIVSLASEMHGAGAAVKVVSASPQGVVEDALRALEAPNFLAENVMGTRVQVDGQGLLTGMFDYSQSPVMTGAGKETLVRELNKPVLLAIGDSEGDLLKDARVSLLMDRHHCPTTGLPPPHVLGTQHVRLEQAVDPRSGQACPSQKTVPLRDEARGTVQNVPKSAPLLQRIVEASSFAGQHVVVETDWEPDDKIWFVGALHKALEVYKQTSDYPIKAIIVGGYHNKVMKASLEWFIQKAYELGWIPQDVKVTIALGPSDHDPSDEKFADTGKAELALNVFSKKELHRLIKESVPVEQDTHKDARDALLTALENAEAAQKPCTLVALAPVFWLKSIKRKDLQRLKAIVMYGDYNTEGLAGVVTDVAKAVPVLVVQEASLMKHGPRSITLKYTPKFIQALERANLPAPLQLIREHGRHWNRNIAASLQNSCLGQVPEMAAFFAGAKGLADADLDGQLEAASTEFPALRHRLSIWRKVFRGEQEQYAPCDPLLLLALHGNPEVMSTLQPVDYECNRAICQQNPNSSVFALQAADPQAMVSTVMAALDRHLADAVIAFSN